MLDSLNGVCITTRSTFQVSAEVTLAPINEATCGDVWPTDTDEGARRKEFCDHVEGYGAVCSCKVSYYTKRKNEFTLFLRVNSTSVVVVYLDISFLS